MVTSGDCGSNAANHCFYGMPVLDRNEVDEEEKLCTGINIASRHEVARALVETEIDLHGSTGVNNTRDIELRSFMSNKRSATSSAVFFIKRADRAF